MKRFALLVVAVSACFALSGCTGSGLLPEGWRVEIIPPLSPAPPVVVTQQVSPYEAAYVEQPTTIVERRVSVARPAGLKREYTLEK